MKNLRILPILGATAALFCASVTSCGDGALKEYPWIMIEDPNPPCDTCETPPGTPTPPADLETLEKTFRGGIPFMINYSHEPTGTWAPHKYQYYRANGIDNYAGYWTTTKATFTFGGPLPVLYTPDNDYLGGAMDNQVFTYCWDAYKYADEFEMPAWRAIAQIVIAYAAHEMVDFYGTIPFHDWINRNTIPPLTWEPGEEIYTELFKFLDDAIKTLKVTQPTPEQLARIEDQTKTVSDGDWRRWVKFANSIRMRMALNIVNYDEAEAEAQYMASIEDEIGPLMPGDRNFGYAAVGERTCCLYNIMHSWGDLRMGGSFENIMKRLQHPLLDQLISSSGYVIKDATSGVPAPAGLYGIRAGVKMDNLTRMEYNYGPFGWLSDKLKNMDQDFFKVEEVLFLRAEGALRGWDLTKSAGAFYEEGVRYFFKDMCRYDGLICDDDAIEAYVNNDKVADIDYIDYRYRQNDMKGRVNVCTKWNENDDNEVKLEKIITQKYIANWPQSAEAWTSFRRTGYPRLFPVPDNLNNFDDVVTELQIRRMTVKETVNNALEVSQIKEVLGGEQGAGTQVFWDCGVDNWIPTSEQGEGGPIYQPVNF